MVPFYQAAFAQGTERLTQILRVEDRGIDPPHAARYGLRVWDDPALQQQARVGRADPEMPCAPFAGIARVDLA